MIMSDESFCGCMSNQNTLPKGYYMLQMNLNVKCHLIDKKIDTNNKFTYNWSAKLRYSVDKGIPLSLVLAQE